MTWRGGRVGVTTLVVAVGIALIVGAGDATAPAAAGASSPGSVSRQLVDDLLRAQTPDQRYSALLAVMQAVHVGVYDGSGHVVVRGAERSADDLYLYDGEVHTLATALATHRTWTLSDLADRLTAAGLTLKKRKRITVAVLHDVLRRGLGLAAAHPRDPRTIEALLVQQLGLRHSRPQDLARRLPDSAVRLDALQFLLLDADFGLPVSDAKRATVATAGCLASGPGPVVPVIANWFTESAEIPELFTHVVSKAQLINAIHGVVLGTVGLATTVHTPNGLTTHYGGMQLHFRLSLVSLDDPETVTCGALNGLHLPPPGPIAGASTKWVGAAQLAQYGTVNIDGADTAPYGLTNSIGESSLTFTPKNEVVPGVGKLVISPGALAITSTFHFAIPGPGGHDFNAAGAIPVYVNWSVSHHAPRGFEFTLKWTGHDKTADDYQTETLQGHVCGDDPFAGTWTIHFRDDIFDPDDAAHYHTVFGERSFSQKLYDGVALPDGTLHFPPASPPDTVTFDHPNPYWDNPSTMAPLVDYSKCPSPK